MKRMKFKTRRKRTPPYFSREPELLDLILPGDVLAFFEVVKVSTTDQPENLCFFHVMRKFCTV